MADVRPFRGVRYDPVRAGSLDRLLAPPYDVVSHSLQEELHRRSPYNVVRLELGVSSSADSAQDNSYTRAAAAMASWLRQGILVREEVPSLYLAVHKFVHRGRIFSRRELTVALRLEEWSAGVVRPHEETAPGPKEDRLALMQATMANISPIMALYDDPTGSLHDLLAEVEGRRPTAQVRAVQEESFTLWAVEDPPLVRAVQGALQDQPVYIADGHHRYETALEYRKRARATGDGAAAEYVLATLIDLSDPGLLCLPYHRLLTGLLTETPQGMRESLEQVFSVRSVAVLSDTPEGVAGAFEEYVGPPNGSLLGVLGLEGSRLHVLSARDAQAVERAMSPGRSAAWRSLAPCLFAEVILPALLRLSQPRADEQGYLDYTPDSADAARRVRDGDADIAFLLSGVPLPALKAVSDASERLPRKSTYFHPKLATGLVMKGLKGPL